MVTHLRSEPTDLPLLEQLQHLIEAAGPTDLTASLSTVLSQLGNGAELFCGDSDSSLTPAEVAKMLGVSRPFVYRLLDRGVLPFHSVGRDRRVPYSAALAYAERRDAGRKELAETFASADADRRALVRELAGVD
jgi:excisionase family DNA binding protein